MQPFLVETRKCTPISGVCKVDSNPKGNAMRIGLTSLALSTAFATSLAVSAHASVITPTTPSVGGASLYLVQHGGGGGGMSHGGGMGGMPRAGGGMPGSM